MAALERTTADARTDGTELSGRFFGQSSCATYSHRARCAGACPEICGGPADYALECTGVISVVEQAIETVGALGTCVLIGGAPAEAKFSVDHFGALWGRRIIGTRIGSATPADLDRAIEAATAAQKEWAAAPYTVRAAVMRKAAALLEANPDRLAPWLVREAGSGQGKAGFEVFLVVSELQEAAAAASVPYGNCCVR